MPASRRNTRRSQAAAAVKEEVVTETVTQDEDVPMTEIKEEDQSDNDNNTEDSQVEGTVPPAADDNKDDSTAKKPWPHRVKEGLVQKVPKDVAKRRRNFRLKKMIIPKNPVMILNELLGRTVQFEVADPLHQGPNFYFMARTVYDDQEFIGNGPSKTIAKNIAAETVLQYITTQTCSRQEAAGGGDEDKPHTFETETPWTALASLAMFKLFNDWQSQGYNLPAELIRNSACSSWQTGDRPQHESWSQGAVSDHPVEKKQKPKKEKMEKPKVEKALPDNPLERHPVQLLNEMKGPLEYEETGREGVPPNCIFTMQVQIGEHTFSGQGRSKKDAKKVAAESALQNLYNLNYQ